MSVPPIRIIGREESLAAPAKKAAKRLWSGAPAGILLQPELDQAVDDGLSASPTLLVLLEPDARRLKQLTAALDERGAPRWALVACTALPAPGDSHAVHVPVADWNESSIAVAFLSAIRLQALRSSNARLGGDLRAVSRRLMHDIRGPLNCIQTSNEALLALPEGAGEARTALGHAISQSADEILSQLTRVSLVLNATTHPISTQSVIMDEVVWGALQRLESRILKGEASVTKPEKWPVVQGVPSWLDFIWANLLANSLQHGGSSPRIVLGWDQSPDDYLFWLQNDGPPVPANLTGRLFYPLDRLGNLDAPRGFGLPLVQRLVELQGGRCGYEATSAGSGIFSFTLPRTVAPATA